MTWMWMMVALGRPANADQAPEPPEDQDQDGWFEWDGDCDDFDPAVYPGALDVCDGKDNDCDGTIDEIDTGEFVLYEDLDGDGIGGWNAVTLLDPDSCPIEAGYSLRNGDCDDDDPLIHPDVADDTCDGVDDDCDGWADDDSPDAGFWYTDEDGDGHAGTGGYQCFVPGAVSQFEDCDDADPTIYNAAPEIYEDGIDQDCNGFDDPWPDNDGDGHPENVDCDDSSPSVHPDGIEACGNSVDDDCDGVVDQGCPDTLPETKGCSTAPTLVLPGLWRHR